MTDQAKNRMQKCLDDLGVPLSLCLQPDPTKSVHGEIKTGFLYIYDAQEDDAWRTLIHEIIEYRLKDLTAVYRTLINKLIEAVQELAYTRKEKFIEFLPALFETVEKKKK